MSLINFEIFLKQKNIAYKKDHFLKYESYFKTGGKAQFFILPHLISNFTDLISYLNDLAMDYKVLGFTSNVYLLDELEYSIIISTKNLNDIEIKEQEMHLSTGYSVEAFSRLMLLESSSGYEGLEGIPASIGGAVVMNASAYNCAISDHLLSVSYINQNNEIKTLSKESCHFGHRNSLFKQDTSLIILSASFQINKGKSQDIAQKMQKYHSARHSYQEFAYPNLGTMFAVKGDFYREFVKSNRFYYLSCYALKILYKNPLMKFIQRKNPQNTLFNALLERYIRPQSFCHPYSQKSMNILINNGSSSLEERLNYLKIIKTNLATHTKLENELLLSPLVPHAKNQEIRKQIQVKGLL